MRKIVMLFALALLHFGGNVFAAQPIDVLRGGVDQVLGILNESQPEEAKQRALQRDRLWAVIKKTFDFREMGSRSLARYWGAFSDAQKEEFTALFSKLLGNTYIGKIQRGFKDEKVVYVGQEMISESKALVKTKVVREGLETPVYYSMYSKEGSWYVYDVNIEGVSLVKNYRSQFGAILLKKSPAQLIKMLKRKVEQMEKEQAVQMAPERPEKQRSRLACLISGVSPQSVSHTSAGSAFPSKHV